MQKRSPQTKKRPIRKAKNPQKYCLIIECEEDPDCEVKPLRAQFGFVIDDLAVVTVDWRDVRGMDAQEVMGLDIMDMQRLPKEKQAEKTHVDRFMAPVKYVSATGVSSLCGRVRRFATV